MRDPVASGADHAVERAAGDGQFGSRLGRNDLLDQRIDRRIGDSAEVLRALDGGGLRGELGTQRVSGRR